MKHELSRVMSKLAKKRWKKTSKEERSRLGRERVMKRWSKKGYKQNLDAE